MDLPEPPIPDDLDLRDFRWMKLDLIALFNSDFNSTIDDTAWRCGVTLWGKAWHQVPAGSLPDDDAKLCNLAGLGRDMATWLKVKAEALHGFEKATNGRLYHKFLCAMAMDAAEERNRYSERRAKDRARKESRNSSGIPAETPKNSSGIPAEFPIEGQGQGQGNISPCGVVVSVEVGGVGEGAADASPSALPPPAPTTAEVSPEAKRASKGSGAAVGGRATRLASGWVLPDEWAVWTRQERPDWTPDHVKRTADRFRDHWHAKGGQDARKADWFATWRNWVRRESAENGNRTGYGRNSRSCGISPEEWASTDF